MVLSEKNKIKIITILLYFTFFICSCYNTKEYIIDTYFLTDSVKQKDFISIIDTITIEKPIIIKKDGLNFLINDTNLYYIDPMDFELESLLFLFDAVVNYEDPKIEEFDLRSKEKVGKETTEKFYNQFKKRKFYMEPNSKFVICKMNAHFYNVFCIGNKKERYKHAIYKNQDSRYIYINVAYSLDYTIHMREPLIVIP